MSMTRPNILILYTDQQRWDALGANGNTNIKTPNLDRLANEGVNFDRYFVQNPVCMPSRVSFLTSQYCSQSGIYQNGVRVPDETPTLATYLSSYGYTCANIGKLHFLPHANRDHSDPHPAYGFHHLAISDEPGCYEDAYRAWARHLAPDQMDRISLGLPPAREMWEHQMGREPIVHPEREKKCAIPFAADDHLTHTAFVADETMRFIDQNQTRPFLAIAGFYSPHSPWITPQKYIDLYDPATLSLPSIPDNWVSPASRTSIQETELRSVRQGYYGMISEVDDHVGRILNHLDGLGKRDNTIVLFISDHGEYLGDYHTYGKGPPGHDCISRVPCIVRFPDGAESGLTVSGIQEAVDVLPTLLDLCAIPIPGNVQGQSFRRALEGDASFGRESALTESLNCRAIRTDAHRYVCHRDGREELYDLTVDPGEYIDVADNSTHVSVLTHHRRLLIQRMMGACLPRRREWAY
jgi:arylsulfatase A-like enzyme